jgi:hypothetical protein
MLEATVAVISALTALGSLWFTASQWRKIRKKIAMVSDAGSASEILPAWYTARMMQDQWWFALQTNDGAVIAIRRIVALSDDAQWMDVELLTHDELPDLPQSRIIVAVADDRRAASVQIKNIVAAYDIVTS